MWWLGTGQNSNAKFAWIVGSDGYAYDNYVDVIRGLRPAVVLTPGITITNNDMTNIGSSTNPYTIE